MQAFAIIKTAPVLVPPDTGPVREGRAVAGRLGTVHWRCLGTTGQPVVAVLGGISACRRVDEWWPEVVSACGALDPRRWCIVSFDWLTRGGAETWDQADALVAVLDALECRRATVVGSSFGGMVGLAFAARHPKRVERVVSIGGAHRSTPSASARRVLQRAIIRFALERDEGQRGVALARALALTYYRPDALIDRRFHAAEPERVVDGLARYFETQGGRFARDFDAQRYLALSEALDRHCVDPAAIRCPVELVGAESDRLVPAAQLRALAGAIGLKARFHRIESDYGHDAFLKSPESINTVLQRVLPGHAEAGHG